VEGGSIVELGPFSVLDVVAGTVPVAADAPRHAITDVTLLSPAAPLVRNAFCVGWNYLRHFEEGRSRNSSITEPPDRPTFFTKATGAIIGPNDPIEAHAPVTSMLDWEVELALLIRRGGRDIAESNAMDHVAGFMVALDVTARDVTRAHGGQWFRGKSLDNTAPVGPWLVTPDELPDFGQRRITCRLNGEVVQSALLADMYFSIPRVIAELSAGLTLRPGDLILTGTPEGTGIGRQPARFLTEGDLLEAEVEGIGNLQSEVVGHVPTVVDSADIFDYVYEPTSSGGPLA
jgi:2-keto-4-pentenoate hydratase/2-oxohepta-3-ene-1,7-dioic acid hydratase in catechol pathway